MKCPMVDEEDDEDSEDTEESELQFDEDDTTREKARVRLGVPAKALAEANIAVAVREPSEPKILEKFVEAVAEPVTVIPKRTPAVTPFVPKKARPKRTPQEVPSVQGEFRGAEQREEALVDMGAVVAEKVAASVNVSVSYAQEMEEQGWMTHMESVGAATRNIVAAANSSQGTSLNPFAVAIVTAAAMERLYTQYVKGSDIMAMEGQQKARRRKGVGTTNRGTAVKDPRKGPEPPKKTIGVRERENRATSREVDKTVKTQARKGVTKTVRSLGLRGRGGFLRIADTFRIGTTRKKVSRRRRAHANYRR